jgi:hypothetical protein
VVDQPKVLGADPAAREQSLRTRSRWLKWFIRLTGISLMIALWPLYLAGWYAAVSALAGYTLSFIMCFAAGWLALSAIGGPMSRVMIIAFGGMLARMVIVAASVTLVGTTGYGQVTGFTIGLMGAYMMYQSLEITMLKTIFPSAAGAAE